MADRTVLNPELSEEGGSLPADPQPASILPHAAPDDGAVDRTAAETPTLLNPDVVQLYNKENGIETPDAETVSEGELILGEYRVIRQLEVSSGEADLFLCTRDSGKYVAKVYKRRFAIKEEVAEKLKAIDSPFVARLSETGTFRGFPVEILPYFENGSLQGRTFSLDELTLRIIPDINEGLKAVHQAGIIHKDLKPSNIMLNTDGEHVSLIDFGISSAVAEDQTILITRTGLTPEYSAPETFRNVFYEGSDYYSLGITIFELFLGYTPYANMQAEEIEQYISVQRIPFPEEMPPRLRDLISALTYYDITNRHDKENPNRRWTYEEVGKWLAGEEQTVPGEGSGNINNVRTEMPPFEFCGGSYTDQEEFAKALTEHWEEGKKELFRGMLTAHFRECRPDLARKCLAAEEEAARENGRDDIIFWKLLYEIDPRFRGFRWRGRSYESIAAFGREMLERLWNSDESLFSYYDSILSEKLLSAYVNHAAPRNEKLKNAAAAIEDSYELEKISGTGKRRTYYLMAYTLSGQKLLLLEGEKFRTTGELANYMRSVLEKSVSRFETLCHKLIDYDGNLDFQLETWLIALGKQAELDRWREAIG